MHANIFLESNQAIVTVEFINQAAKQILLYIPAPVCCCTGL